MHNTPFTVVWVTATLEEVEEHVLRPIIDVKIPCVNAEEQPITLSNVVCARTQNASDLLDGGITEVALLHPYLVRGEAGVRERNERILRRHRRERARRNRRVHFWAQAVAACARSTAASPGMGVERHLLGGRVCCQYRCS